MNVTDIVKIRHVADDLAAGDTVRIKTGRYTNYFGRIKRRIEDTNLFLVEIPVFHSYDEDIEVVNWYCVGKDLEKRSSIYADT